MISRRLPAICAATALLLAGASAFAEPQIGGVAQKDYMGATGTRTTASARDLYFNEDVFAGETVATPANGSTKLRFRDRTELQIGANSSVVLDRFVYDPGARTGDAAIKFGKGIFRFVTGDITNKDAVKLTTPTASLTIRGTDLKIFVDADGSTTMQVDEGEAVMTPCGGGNPVSAHAGQALKVSASCDGARAVGLSGVPHDPGVDGGGPGGGGNNNHPGNPPAPSRSEQPG
jgi:hypothetical protein